MKEYYLGPDKTLDIDTEYERILFRSRPSFRLDPEYERIPEIPPQQSGNPISMILK